ncbi:hypothetical protein AMAG_04868 [Allomyces macrogynus ATCC 38327]|uniref:Uncharacterized protein n=1 Tax=Allomyces macrogynus (strain ATCC 38327) TaxID=578462 RepID=A0A0L0S6B5_ALLM3|nr:hypothetical protein AMAG_04868 [Allomyces macrogynus ATCC 38327]|eukprot:KNE58042.1 hypothetical protein AMAG_04868 [Allomyces macrogynus ATCC 38327]
MAGSPFSAPPPPLPIRKFELAAESRLARCTESRRASRSSQAPPRSPSPTSRIWSARRGPQHQRVVVPLRPLFTNPATPNIRFDHVHEHVSANALGVTGHAGIPHLERTLVPSPVHGPVRIPRGHDQQAVVTVPREPRLPREVVEAPLFASPFHDNGQQQGNSVAAGAKLNPLVLAHVSGPVTASASSGTSTRGPTRFAEVLDHASDRNPTAGPSLPRLLGRHDVPDHQCLIAKHLHQQATATPTRRMPARRFGLNPDWNHNSHSVVKPDPGTPAALVDRDPARYQTSFNVAFGSSGGDSTN